MLVALLGMVVGTTCVVPSAEAESVDVTWETDFAFIHFEWNGAMDNVAWWSYGLWYLDVPDWAYLFAVYGIGWDHIWGPALWGTDGVWGAEDKINIYVQRTAGSTHTQALSGQIWYFINDADQLELAYGGWVNQVCTAGRGLTFGATLYLAGQFGCAHIPWEIAFHVAAVLWPWGDHLIVGGYDVSTLEGIRAGYQHWHSGTGAHGEHDYSSPAISWYYQDFYPPLDGMRFFDCIAAGYVLSDFDYLFNSAAAEGGASSKYRIATLLTIIKADPIHDIVAASMTAYGHWGFSVGQMGLDPWVKLLDPDYNYLDAWLYNLMWGEWYQYLG